MPHRTPDAHNAYMRVYQRKRRADGVCLSCSAPSEGGARCPPCTRRSTEQMRILRRRRRDRIVAAYGGCCACCGEREPLFLTIDHINGGGKAHMAKLAAESNSNCGPGDRFYKEIERQGFPPEYRVLCWNCNAGRFRNGGECPHTTSTLTS